MKPDDDLKTHIRDGSATPVSGSGQMTAGQIADRGTPNWARYVSFLFSIGTALCLLAVAVLTIFMQSLVALEGEVFATPMLLALALVAVLGGFILDYAHARALAGYRQARMRTEALAQAGVAVLLTIALAVLHPLLAVPSVSGAIFLWVTHYALSGWGQIERLWDFRSAEAAAFLTGRDEVGYDLARRSVTDHALAPQVTRVIAWMAMAIAFGLASWLTAEGVLSMPAIAAVGLITFWAVGAMGQFAQVRLVPDPNHGGGTARVETFGADAEELQDAAKVAGLHVRQLTVEDAAGPALLQDVSFDVAPGEVIGVIGDAAAGKSLLLRSLLNPFDLEDAYVRGRVTYNGVDVWTRSNEQRGVAMVHVPSQPRMLPTTGDDNLTCFRGEDATDRAGRCLESLVFSSDAVDRIRSAPNATLLSASDQKALSLARAFLMNPACYLIDRPEDALSEKSLASLLDRIQMERRAGRSFVIVSEHRALLEACDKLLMLQDGRVLDFAPATEIRRRLSSGWVRFVTPRHLESEDTLTAWIRSHFKRNGDEGNRRSLCTVAAELLALSCQDATTDGSERVYFDFKHFEGHALLKLTDNSPLLTSGRIELAEREAVGETGPKKSPLAKLIHLSEAVEQSLNDGRRVLTVRVATYDPRKNQAGPSSSA
ncbi:ATP-binding cassette domain-containing protein [Shimia ponticola]|uniref:ATP-binding cassette domain-containing protein n=1 Tax=Shimia ponticola TaxID=2582893 RepID=UPI0011BFA2CA|nr:ATP-binding cassette domain-containing protein [Shimia ponticola]